MEGTVNTSTVAGWTETTSDDPNDPWCTMNSDEPGLEDLFLAVATSCEPLHPVASKLSYLSAIAAGDTPSNKDDVPVDTPLSIAGPLYTELLADAVPVGTEEFVESKDLDLASLDLTKLDITPFGSRAVSGQDSEICVEGYLNVGAFKDPNLEEFNVPGLAAMNPAGQIVWLDQEKRHENVEEFDDIDLTYCGKHTAHFRDATYLLVSYDEINDEYSPVWEFDLAGEQGIS